MSNSVAMPPTSPVAKSPENALDRVHDPEIPVLTIRDLGVLRTVTEHDDGHIEVVITPTYSGCPAMDMIRADIVRELAADGFTDVTVTTRLSPAWSSDDITDEGREALRRFGIAPPHRVSGSGPVTVTLGTPRRAVRCPQCQSPHTREVSRFGSTACKAHYVCQDCREPFDYFKDI